jgi:predicted enzyme related to lactoylglutathione lyase
MTEELNPVNWFEIPAININKAKQFYESVFNIELSLNDMDSLKMAWFPMTENAPGSTGALVQAEGYTPSHAGTQVYFSVEDIEATLDKVTLNGGKVLGPKKSIGEYGFVAYFEDCEGNRISIHSKK